jgi:REP element-mobilizing transposase RayT
LPEIRERLWSYLGGIAHQNEMTALAIGGTDDHVHLLVSLPATLPVSKAIQLIKGGSSKWIHETFPTMGNFAWQEGYGAFSVGVSGVDDTIAYITNQAEHHRTKTFEEEFISFLKRHNLPFDDRYVFG